jgi:hypothetical protein
MDRLGSRSATSENLSSRRRSGERPFNHLDAVVNFPDTLSATFLKGAVMAQVTICGKAVPYAFAASVVDPARSAAAVASFQAMAGYINAQNPVALAGVFTLIDSVMFFEDNIANGAYSMDRSFTDLPTRQFNWKLGEFLDPNHRPCSRATYYFHDAWHVHQFSQAGVYPPDHPTQAQWEVDAVQQQINSVGVLGCGQYLVDFLNSFDHSYDAILARLEAGVAPGVCAGPHTPVAMA